MDTFTFFFIYRKLQHVVRNTKKRSRIFSMKSQINSATCGSDSVSNKEAKMLPLVGYLGNTVP